MMLTIYQASRMQVLLAVRAEGYELLELIRDTQLFPQLPRRLTHRFPQANMTCGAAVEVAREGILGVGAMLKQDLDLPISRPGNPAKECLVPQALEVSVSATGALAGRLAIRCPDLNELVRVGQDRRVHGSATRSRR